jgi:hypothetical protein
MPTTTTAPKAATKSTTKATKKPKSRPQAALRVVDSLLLSFDPLPARALRHCWSGYHPSVLRDQAFLAGLAQRGLELRSRGRWKTITRTNKPQPVAQVHTAI